MGGRERDRGWEDMREEGRKWEGGRRWEGGKEM